MEVMLLNQVVSQFEITEPGASPLLNLDPVTWIILGVLLLISLSMLAISIERYFHYRKTSRSNQKFLKTFRDLRTAEMMKNLAIAGDPAPFTEIFMELNKRIFPVGTPDNPEPLPPLLQELEMLSQRLIREQKHILEGKISFLATTSTVSPFFGLLGTVWGIMLAFLAMGKYQSTEISAVGPGIAAALITTIVGLVVAIPAVIFYNVLNARLRSLVIEMENFSSEVIARALQWGLVE